MELGIMGVFREGRPSILLSILIGVCGYGLTRLFPFGYSDPLIFALIIGIIVRTAIGDRGSLNYSASVATSLFIPIGIVFYAFKNLHAPTFVKVETGMIILLAVVVAVYFGGILLLGKLMGQRRQITYLTATGSAICGASAIAIVAPAVEAEPDDVSISLLAVFLAALVGLFTALPFLGTLFDLTSRTYGILAGSVLQFTGFVKAAVDSVPYLTKDIPQAELVSLSLSVKAARYLGLLIGIPLFASLIRKKLYFPWQLWLFLGSGLAGTMICSLNELFYYETLLPLVAPAYDISWSVAMAAIGLNADVTRLLSNNGIKALGMAFGGFFLATITFFLGLVVIQLMG